MIDLTKILHIGDELYSPICGNVTVTALEKEEVFCITCKTPYGAYISFDKRGRHMLGGECMLLPCKGATQEDWNETYDLFSIFY